ncbi:hypothetical protein HAX54_017762 [Datura stramonium]|uniref:Secreted protein n=1 Tax=Datura stramonium TaxID=4076 RepID=A0ABS8UP13_DATST|nr:hypothetical protein [Datura stramonium]
MVAVIRFLRSRYVFSFGIVLWEILTVRTLCKYALWSMPGGIVNNTLRPPVPSFCDTEWRMLAWTVLGSRSCHPPIFYCQVPRRFVPWLPPVQQDRKLIQHKISNPSDSRHLLSQYLCEFLLKV